MLGYLENVATTAGINAIITIGLTVVVMSGQLSVCNAALAGLAAYTAASLSIFLGLPFLLSVLLGAALAAAVGAALSLVCRNLQGFYLAIATLAFGAILVTVFENLQVLGGAMGLARIPPRTSFFNVYAVLVVLLCLLWRFERSRFGVALYALADDPIAASAMGIHVVALKVLAFALGAFISGLGGGLYAHYATVVVPGDLSFHQEINLYLYAGVGGLTSYWGAVLGAFALAALTELLRFSIYERYLLFGLLLALIMLLKPEGLVKRFPRRN